MFVEAVLGSFGGGDGEDGDGGGGGPIFTSRRLLVVEVGADSGLLSMTIATALGFLGGGSKLLSLDNTDRRSQVVVYTKSCVDFIQYGRFIGIWCVLVGLG
jgi:hypothetical protein